MREHLDDPAVMRRVEPMVDDPSGELVPLSLITPNGWRDAEGGRRSWRWREIMGDCGNLREIAGDGTHLLPPIYGDAVLGFLVLGEGHVVKKLLWKVVNGRNGQ